MRACLVILLLGLAGCVSSPPARPPVAAGEPCDELLRAGKLVVYPSKGPWLVGRAACDQYLEDVRAAQPAGLRETLMPPPLAVPTEPAPGPTGPARPSPAEYAPRTELRPVHFDFDSADIRAEDRLALDGYAAWLAARPPALLLVEGHADERGTNEYNVALGARRAAAVKAFLVARGVAAARILTISYGEERPACTERTEECWARNRRAEFLVKGQ